MRITVSEKQYRAEFTKKENSDENQIVHVGCRISTRERAFPSPDTIFAAEKDMMKDEKDMMKDEKDAMMKDKMKAEKKGQAGKPDEKMKMDEKKQ
ncbi:MAG: hypothetical protein WD688_05085 [Candidatus Binatia bacterium]